VSYPDDLRAQVDRYLEEIEFEGPPAAGGLVEAMRYSLLAGGKRIRPVLALATARSLGAPAEEVLPFAASVELVHTYSLIHDDLPAMDDDELRRGRPTCHVEFGEDVAILAGDALYAEAFRLLLAEQPGADGRRLAAALELARATGTDGMVGGQFIDVRERSGPGPEGLQELHALKTGRLIAVSVEGPCLLLGVQGEALEAYRRFARELGLLFQIVDDVLDVTASDEELGKPSGSDARHGKRTYVSEFGTEEARELAAASRDRALEALGEAAGAGAAELEAITRFIADREN
jgi:geranylgeranyl diphosphate synthase type II